MGFDSKEHLKVSLKLAKVIRDTVRPLVGVYEDCEHSCGATGDTTFEIDVPVEARVHEFFQDAGLGVKLLTEDRGEVLFGQEHEAVYLIDPLDGSRNARRGLPVYSCSIAVYTRSAQCIGDAVVGVVSRLDAKENYAAVAGEGAERNGKTIKASGKRDLRDAVISVGSHMSSAYGAHSRFMSRLSEEAGRGVNDVWVKCYGSTALELAYLASGCADMLVDLRAAAGLEAAPKTYDAAAGLLLCRESGAEVLCGSESLPQKLPVDPHVRVQLLGAGSRALLNKISKYV